MTIQELATKDKNNLISRALEFAKTAHSGEVRMDHSPYFEHAVQTAEILNQWNLDEESIASGLLHDTIKHGKATEEVIKKKFGAEVAFLVQGVTKLGLVKYRGPETKDIKIENLRKLILALNGDLRTVFIKLANRLHNMRTITALPEERRQSISKETEEIYAPLASLLGMQSLSGELYDLSFPHTHEKEYAWLSQIIKDQYEDRENYLRSIEPLAKKCLDEYNLAPLFIDFRAKRISSLYRKLLTHDMDIEKIYDLVAMRIIMEETKDCYEALGAIHTLWPPLPGRIKDYIASPKPNSYRSLHTTVTGPDGKIIEIQIKTKTMHDDAENGIASHWLYKEKYEKKNQDPKPRLKKIIENVNLIKHLRRWQEKNNPETSHQEFLASMKFDFFKDRIFTLTPKGDVLDLPLGSTPVDFAYKVHSEIGHTCVKSKINGEFKPLNFALKSGDVVEIITQKNKKPSQDWLTFVKTAEAKNRIRGILKAKNNRLEKRFD
jgi:GTP pyrophosphokinase